MKKPLIEYFAAVRLKVGTLGEEIENSGELALSSGWCCINWEAVVNNVFVKRMSVEQESLEHVASWHVLVFFRDVL